MNMQNTTDKVADGARKVADDVLNKAEDAVKSTRQAADESLDKAFAALADPVRRAIVARLSRGAARSLHLFPIQRCPIQARGR